MPIPQDEVTLLSYFETGDKPTQAQYAELIQTMFALVQEAFDEAAAATAVAEAAEERAPKALANATHPGAGTTYTLTYQHNIANIQTLAGPKTRITFTEALNDTDYVVQITPVTSTAHPDQIQILDRQTTHCDIAIYDGATFMSQVGLQIAIFRG